MNRTWTRIWKIALPLCAAGIVLGGVGYALGGPRPVQWGRNGVHALPLSDVHVDEPTLFAFTAIKLDVDTANVSVVQGDHFGLQADIPQTYRTIEWTNKNGTLTISDPSPIVLVNVSSFARGTITITVPATVVLDTVDATTGSGNISVTVPTKVTTITSSSGNVDVSDADVASASVLTVKTGSGNVTYSAATTSVTAATITTDSGNVTASSTGDGAATNLNITTDSGSVNVTEGAGTAGTYVTTNSGDVRVTCGPVSIGLIWVTTDSGDVVFTQTNGWGISSYKLITDSGTLRALGPDAPTVTKNAPLINEPETDYNDLVDVRVTTNSGDITATFG